jgi:hypothetical protein
MHTPDGGIELTRGVAAGDLMVVRGIEPLSDGAPVKLGSTLTLDAAPARPAAAGSAAPAAAGSAAPDAPAGAPEPEPAAGSGSGHRHRAKDAP